MFCSTHSKHFSKFFSSRFSSSFCLFTHGSGRKDRESDKEDFDIFLYENDEEEPAEETADVTDDQWSEKFTPQTKVRFE